MGVEKHVLFSRLTEKRRLLAQHLKDPAAVGFWKMVVDKYAVKAHFIFELLQNSDDALATSVRIILSENGLYYIHNGCVGFSLTNVEQERDGVAAGHINAITSIGASTKLEGNKIGKFGIGFKSVFQYTSLPHIEDDFFSFRIENYIVPVEEPHLNVYRNEGETLFYLPFDNKSESYNDILSTLKTMSNPLLFLNNIVQIIWETDNGENGGWNKSELASQDVNLSTFKVNCKKNRLGENDYKLCICKNIADSSQCVTIVYNSDEEGNIYPRKESGRNLYCFFPLVEQILSLPFVIHAPFLLTENREQIKKTESWNRLIFETVSDILAEIPCLLSQLRLHNDSFLNLIPIKKVDYPLFDYSRYIERLLNVLNESSVFYTRIDRYVKGTQLRIPSNETLTNVFSEEKMQVLFPEETLFWSAYPFYNYQENFLLKHKIIKKHTSLENILVRISEEFMSNQPKEWVSSLYECVLSELEDNSKDCTYLKYSPIFLCEDGKYRSIYDRDNTVQLFVTDQSVTFNGIYNIDNSLVENKTTKKILEQLGVSKPSQKTLVERSILPRYLYGKVTVDDLEQITDDIIVLSSYFSSVSYLPDEKNAFLDRLCSCAFLPSLNIEGRKKMSKPSECYFDTSHLRTFFKNNLSVSYLLQDIVSLIPIESRNSFYYLLTSAGVSFYPRVKNMTIIPTDSVLADMGLTPVSLRVYDNGDQLISDKEIDGFNSFMENWSDETAIAFFISLGKMIGECGAYAFGNQLKGEYSYFEKSKTNRTKENILKTTAYRQLFEFKWFPGVDGRAKSFSEISTSEDLSIGCFSDDAYKFVLQFFSIRYVERNRMLTTDDKRKISLIDRLNEMGISESDLENLIKGDAKICPAKNI